METIMNKRLKLFKNQKGLTLIELLAVIVVLGIIAAIAVPSVSSIIRQSKLNADLSSYRVIKDAGLRYAMVKGTTGDVTLSQLQSDGYLNDLPKVQSDRLKEFTKVNITLDSNTYKVEVHGTDNNNQDITITESTFE